MNQVKSKLQENEDLDKRLAREKLTQMRLKKKRKMRERQGRYADGQEDGEEGEEEDGRVV